MANPQVENGFLRIATELAEALARVNLSPYESRVLWFVLRKTYGYGKKIDRISLSQFESGTGIKDRHVVRAIKSLIKKRILLIHRDSPQSVSYGIQKDYEAWLKPLPIQGDPNEGVPSHGVPNQVQTPPCTGSETSTSTGRHNRKKIITKESAAEAAFERAWSLYPKRAGGNSKKNAYAKWMARVRSDVDPDELIAGVERYARYIRATGGEGTRYVKQCEAFFGPGEHWKEPWSIPTPEPNTYRAKDGFVG